MTNSPALATLVARCQAALESSDPRTEVVAALEDLVANPAELLEQLGTPGLDGPATGIDETIHEDDLLTVMICHTRPGLDQPPHDHRMQAIIGGYDGVERHRFFTRTDSGLERVGTRDLAAGQVIALPDDAVHAIAATNGQWCRAVHVYFGSISSASRSLFHPVTFAEVAMGMDTYLDWCRPTEQTSPAD
ncbi:MAG: hypothetical protein ACKVHU_13700 [Acidimicrobiales bacterium]|jgi:predicted metal-dependent enzyme (double-stranded beta helix superfamily)